MALSLLHAVKNTTSRITDMLYKYVRTEKVSYTITDKNAFYFVGRLFLFTKEVLFESKTGNQRIPNKIGDSTQRISKIIRTFVDR